jgi:hypothetical protein
MSQNVMKQRLYVVSMSIPSVDISHIISSPQEQLWQPHEGNPKRFRTFEFWN